MREGKEKGLAAIREIIDTLHANPMGGRTYYSPEERLTKTVTTELSTVLQTAEKVIHVMDVWLEQIDPFSQEYDQLANVVSSLQIACTSAMKTLESMPQKYKPKQGTVHEGSEQYGLILAPT